MSFNHGSAYSLNRLPPAFCLPVPAVVSFTCYPLKRKRSARTDYEAAWRSYLREIITCSVVAGS